MKRQYLFLVLIITIAFAFLLFSSFYLPGLKISGARLQQAKLPAPMILPKIIQAKGKYYILSQGNSDGFRKQFGISDSALGADTQIRSLRIFTIGRDY